MLESAKRSPRGSALLVRLLVAIATLILMLSAPGCRGGDRTKGSRSRHRIVCLTPSSTELVAAVGATDDIVGVDQFSSYPPEVLHLPRVGDFLSPNLEAILALHPDIAVLDAVQSQVAAKLQAAGITTLSVPIQTIDDIRAGFSRVGDALGHAREARAALAAFDAALADTRDRAADRRRSAARAPRVLFVVDRRPGSLAGMVAAGPHTYLDEIIAILGAENALSSSPVPYANLSAEQVITLAPDVILDATHVEDARRARSDWDTLSSVPAVASGRVHLLADSAAVSPGPRLPAVLTTLLPLVWPSP